jgi:hypothetical protein
MTLNIPFEDRLLIAVWGLRQDGHLCWLYKRIRVWCLCRGETVPDFCRSVELTREEDARYWQQPNMYPCPLDVITRAKRHAPPAVMDVVNAEIRLSRDTRSQRRIDELLEMAKEQLEKEAIFRGSHLEEVMEVATSAAARLADTLRTLAMEEEEKPVYIPNPASTVEAAPAPSDPINVEQLLVLMNKLIELKKELTPSQVQWLSSNQGLDELRMLLSK